MKKCTKCKIEKPLTEFYKDKQKKDGLSPHCKKCKCKMSKKFYNSTSYYENNKNKYFQRSSSRRENNLEEIREKDRLIQNKRRQSETEKEREERLSYGREWAKKNRQHLNNYQNQKYQNSPWNWRWRGILQKVITYLDTPKQNTTDSLLKYSALELKEHLENQGMDWNIHQIDHKIPISWFKKNTPPHIINDLRNLQPLTQKENLKKSNKFASPTDFSYINEVKKWIKPKYLDKLC